MALTVKNISLWRKELENQPGTLAHTLEPVTKAGANLQILMGYRYPGEGTRAAIELYPVTGKKASAAASEAGLSASSIPTLLVEGDDRPGLALTIAQAMSRAGINMTFFVAQAVGLKPTPKQQHPSSRRRQRARRSETARPGSYLRSCLFCSPLKGRADGRSLT
jgi:hypothetical protein